MESKLQNKKDRVPAWVVLAWNSRSISVALSVVILMQITYYSTEYLGLSAGVVGTLFMLSKIFDGFTDLVVGFIIDKTNTKLGKARPYELFVIPLWVLIVALYSTPDVGTTGKMVYIFIMYTLINSVCSTFLQASETVYMGRAFDSDQARAKVMSIGGVIVMFLSTVSSILLPQLMVSWGTQPGGWTKISLAYAIPMLAIGLFRFIFIKEKKINTEDEARNKMGFVEGLKILFKNKYIFILSALIFFSFMGTNIGTIVGTYYFTYVYGDLGIMSIMGMAGLVAPLVFLLFPVAARTMGSLRFVQIGLLLAALANAIRFFFPVNIPILMATNIISAVGMSSITMMNHFFILQCVDYGEIKTGKRVEGTPAALSNFANKIGSGIASVSVGGIMALAGYASASAVQPDSAIMSIRLLYSIIPAVIALVMLVVSHFFNVEKILVKLRGENNL